MIDSAANEVNTGSDDNIDVSKENLLTYLFKKYGTIGEVTRITNQVLNHATFLNKNKYAKHIKTFLPVGLIAYDFYTKIKQYYKEKNKQVGDDKREHISQILKTSCDDLNTHCLGDMRLNPEMLHWLMGTPTVKAFTVVGYYDMIDYNEVEFFDVEKHKEFGVVIKFRDYRYLLIVEALKTFSGDVKFYMKDIYTSEYDWDVFCDFKMEIFKEYLSSLNFDENVITYDLEVQVRPRIKDVNFDFKSIDFDKFKKEINTSLINGYRRGYILVGNPGTGKTSILLRLENELRHYPIVYVSPNNISDERKINTIFSFLKVITPCIVCLEDFDSYGFDSKNGTLGVFLNQIDNSKEKLNIVYVATINDSKKLNYALIRPGRFDVVIEVHEPKDNDEIYSIMKTHYTRQMAINERDPAIPFVDRKSISWFTFWRLKKHILTQADYCEIIQKLILDGEEITNSSLLRSRDRLLVSRKTLRKYKHNDDE